MQRIWLLALTAFVSASALAESPVSEHQEKWENLQERIGQTAEAEKDEDDRDEDDRDEDNGEDDDDAEEDDDDAEEEDG